ncbi:MAG: argininosuccinate lyase [Chloroflexota bacterium]
MNEQAGHLGVGDRLKEGPAPELVASAFALEAGDGPLLYRAMSLADLAHAVMLIETGLIPPAAGDRLLAVLLELHAIPPEQFPFDPARGDAYSNREYVLRQQAPEAAGWLQAGRPRREVSTLAYLIVTRERLLALAGALLDLMRALLALAGANLDTLMPDYTYLQTAHPTTLAHYLLTFVQPMTRDLARLRAAYERTNLSPAGSGSTNGSRLPLNRLRLAELLGFDGLVLHTRDAMWQPDGPIEVMSVVVAMLVNADRLAEDLQIWATSEFGFIELADRYTRISVIMPQKKNPYSLAFVRGIARQAIGKFVSTAVHQMTPSGQVDNRVFAYGDVPRALAEAGQALSLLAGTVAALTVNRSWMAQRAGEGFSGATDLTEVLMLTCKLDAHMAHRLVGRAVRVAVEEGTPLTADILEAVAQAVLQRPLGVSNETIAAAMNPVNIVHTRTGPGGASPSSVQEMINTFRNAALAGDIWQTTCRERGQAAEKRLLERARELTD